MVIGKDIHQQDHLPAGLYLPFAPMHFVPPLKRLRGKLRQLSPTVDTCSPFNEPFHSLPAAHKVHRAGKQRSNRVELLRMPKEVVRYRRSMLFMPAMGKFRLHLDRKSTRLNSSHVAISYAVFCLKEKKN